MCNGLFIYVDPFVVIKWVYISTNIYIHTQTPKEESGLNVPFAITRQTANFTWGLSRLMSKYVIGSIEKSMVICDTGCPYWDQVLLKQHKTQNEQNTETRQCAMLWWKIHFLNSLNMFHCSIQMDQAWLKSLMAQWLSGRLRDMIVEDDTVHDLDVMILNPSQVELQVHCTCV